MHSFFPPYFSSFYLTATYINAHATFMDPHTLEYQLKGGGKDSKIDGKTDGGNDVKNNVKHVCAAHIVIAVVGRPLVLEDIPGE